MARERLSTDAEGEVNPYIAFSDLVVTALLAVVLCIALSRLGLLNEDLSTQEDFDKAVKMTIKENPPTWTKAKNDPLGSQRWVFRGATLFENSEIINGHVAPPKLKVEGKRSLEAFASVLLSFQGKWQRIRVEGHTRPPVDETVDDWELSSTRAAGVARHIQEKGHIPPYYLAVAGRAGQNPAIKIILFLQTATPSSQALSKSFTENQVSFSRKWVTTPESLSQLITSSLKGSGFENENGKFIEKGREMSLPFVLVLKGDKAYFVSGSDGASIQDLIKEFRINDRVEIIVEYTGRQSS